MHAHMDCVFICICKTHAKTLLSWSSYIEVLLRLEDFLRTCNSACDWIQFESIRKIQTQRFRAKDASAVEWKSSALLIKKLWCEGERKQWVIFVGASESAWVFLFGRRGKKEKNQHNETKLLLCLTLFVFLLSLPSVSFSLPSLDS